MKHILIVGLSCACIQAMRAQPSEARTSVNTTLGENKVTITVSGGQRLVAANGLPNHTTGQFPGPRNPNRISAQSYSFHVPTSPKAAAQPVSSRGAWFGVALNGVPFEPGTAEFWHNQPEWVYEAKAGFIDLGLDQNNAHVQPTGAYHYHGLPTGLMNGLGGDGNKMLLVGWAADGFPMYTSFAHSVAANASSPLKKMRSSWQIKKGQRPDGPGGNYDGRFTSDYEYVQGAGDLDECNGRYGVTPEFPNGTYYYCITDEFPQLGRQWHGTPDSSFYKRGPGPGGGGPLGRRGPPGGLRGPGGQRPPGPPTDTTATRPSE